MRLRQCIMSLLKTVGTTYEVIVVDQSKHSAPLTRISGKIHSVHAPGSGKALALNQGARIASGEILAFTDDDCIVSPGWLFALVRQFKKTPSVSAVFGSTRPYQPMRHQHRFCPSIFAVRQTLIHTKPVLHSTHIGYGNNMAIRKTVFDTLGPFKTWLGPGSIGSNAEDAEYALRILTKGGTIASTPRAIVYHNRWLSSVAMDRLELSYVCGEMACYTYYYLQGLPFAKTIIRANISDSLRSIGKNARPTIKKQALFHETGKLFMRMRGCIVGVLAATFEK